MKKKIEVPRFQTDLFNICTQITLGQENGDRCIEF